MVNNDFNLEIGVTANVDSKKIQSEIDKQAKDVKVKLGADSSTLQSDINKIAQGLKGINVKVDSSSLKQMSVSYDEIAKSGKNIQTINAQLVNQQGQLISTTQKFNSESGELLSVKNKLVQKTQSETSELLKQAQLLSKQSILINQMSKGDTKLKLLDMDYGNIEQFSRKIKSLQNDLSSVKNTGDLDGQQNKWAKINQEIQLLNKETSIYKQNAKLEDASKQQQLLVNKIELTKTRAETASKSFKAYLNSLNPQVMKSYSTEIKNISNMFEQARQSGNQIDLTKANSQLTKFKGTMKETGMEAKTFFASLKDNVSAFSNWFLIGGAVASFVGNFKSAIGVIKEVDTLLTEISKTSSLSGDALKQLGVDAYDSASKYGNTVQSYLSGYLEMSRGTDEGTAKKLAELSILAQSAGDMTADLANAYIVATNAAYKYGNDVSKLNAVLDGQNQITNRNQVSMTDLAEATKVAGSQASQSGIEVDKMSAATGTMIATTKQGGEIAGRAFKGILMNLSQVSGEIDGEVFNTESFKKAEKALSDVGVATEEIVNGTAKLRDPMEILKELAKVYNSLPNDSVKKANIISDLGGKHYGNQLSSLLSGWNTYEKMLSDYQNSNGSALNEAKKTADSLEGRLNTLGNTWDRTVANIVNSDLLKFFVNAGIEVVDFTDKSNILQTALVALGGLALFKGGSGLVSMLKSSTTSMIAFGNALNTVKASDFVVNSTNLTKVLSGLSESQTLAVLSSKELASAFSLMSEAQIETTLTSAGLSPELAKTTASTLAMSTAEEVATATTVGFGTSFKALTAAIMANPIGLIITGITVAVSALSFGINEYKQKQEEAIQQSQKLTDSYNEEKKSIEDQVSTYKSLKEQLDNGNLSTEETSSIKAQLIDIQNKLTSSYGEEANKLDLVNGKYKEQIELLNGLSKKNATQYLAENKSGYESDKKMLNKKDNYKITETSGINLSDELYKYLSNYSDSLSVRKMGNQPGETLFTGKAEISLNNMSVEDAYKTISKLYTDIDEKFGKGKDSEKLKLAISNVLNDSFDKDKIDKAKQRITDYTEAQVIANNTLRPLYEKSVNAVEKYNKALSSGKGVNEAKQNIEAIKQEVSDSTNLVSGSGTVFDNIFNSIANSTDKASQSTQSATSALDNYNETASETPKLAMIDKDTDASIDTFQSQIEKVNSAIQSLDNGSLNKSQVVDLMQELGINASKVDLASNSFTGLREQLLNVSKVNLDQIKATLADLHIDKKIDDSTYKNLVSTFNQMTTATTDWQSVLTTAREKISSLSGILSEMNAKKFKGFSDESMNKLISDYPQLLGYLGNEKALRKELTKLIDEQKNKSANAYVQMEADSKTFYNSIKNSEQAKIQNANKIINSMIQNNRTLVSTLGSDYRVDLNNFSSIVNAKAKLEEQLIRNSAKAWAEYYKVQVDASGKAVVETKNADVVSKSTNGNVGAEVDNYVKQGKAANTAAKAYNTAIKQLNNIAKSATINSPVVTPKLTGAGNTGSGKSGSGNSGKSSKSKFSQEIDWRQRYIDSIKTSIEELNTLLDNTSSPDKQAKIYNKLTDAQTKLQKAYSTTASSYKNQYEKTLNKTGKNKSAYQKLIESGSSFKVTDFKNEKIYNAVSKAKDLYDSYKENKNASKEAGYEVTKFAKSLASITWDKATKKAESLNNTVATLNTELDNTDNFDARNKKLEEILSKQKQIIKNYQDAVKSSQKEEDSLYKKLTKQLSKKEEKDTKGGKLSKGEKVQTKGLSGNDLSLAKKYNASVDAVSTNKKNLKTQKIDVNNDISDTNDKQYENTISKYEAQLDILENKKKDIENDIATAESKGGTAKAKQYQNEIAYNNQEIAKYSDLIEIVKTQMKSADKNSAKWQELDGALQGYQDTMNGLVQSSQDFEKQIKQLEFTSFDNGMDKVDGFQEDLDFLTGLIDDNNTVMKDSGKISQDGLSKLALLETGYASAYEEAKRYNQEIQNLGKMYKDHSSKEYLDRLSDLKSGLHSAVTQTNDYKSAITELMTTIKDGEIEALDNKLDKFNDLIDAQKKALESEKSLHDYEESISGTTSDMEKIQKRIVDLKRAANSGDREAQKELKEQQDALADKEKELTETKYDREKDLEEEALDRAKSDYEKYIEAQKKALEEYYKNQQKLMLDVANLTKDKFTEVYNTLLTLAKDNNLSISSDLQEQLSKVISGMSVDFAKLSGLYPTETASDGNTSGSGSASGSIGHEFKNKGQDITKQFARNIMQNGHGSADSNSELNKYIVKTLKYKPINYDEMVDLAQLLSVGGINSASDVKGNDKNKNKILAKLKTYGKFKDGGVVDTKVDPLIRKLTGEDTPVLVKNGEGILKPAETQNYLEFTKDTIPRALNILEPLVSSRMNPSNLIQKTNNAPVTLQVDTLFNVETVTGYDDFMVKAKENIKDLSNMVTDTINKARR